MSIAAVILAGVLVALEHDTQTSSAQLRDRLRVFLDCSDEGCHEDYLREELDFVAHVRDRSDSDVHVLVTQATTGARGSEYTLAFIGQGSHQATTRTLTVVSESSDSEDHVRRRLLTAVRIGLLSFVAPDNVPVGLEVDVDITTSSTGSAVAADDAWNRWIFSLNGNGELDAEESTRERTLGINIGADRITPAWKLSFGTEFNDSREEFDLDEDEPLSVERRDRAFRWLVVRSLSEHWSIGARGEFRSSTFDNTELDIRLAPAIEWNFFPYSMYTRRQLRVLYAVGGARTSYYEETLFRKLEETRARQELSGTYEQREPWGTLEGSVEWSNYFPRLSTNRVSVEGEANLRIARGLSFTVEASGSRIRDQLSLPLRDATPEEVLLRLRQLSSGFETRVEFGITYQFGSRFASIVNPRFGQ